MPKQKSSQARLTILQSEFDVGMNNKEYININRTDTTPYYWRCSRCNKLWTASNRARYYNNQDCPDCAKLYGAKKLQRKVCCVEINKTFDSVTDAAEFANVSISSISIACRTGRIIKHCHWDYVD